MFTFRKILVPLAVFCAFFATICDGSSVGRTNESPAVNNDNASKESPVDNATVEYYEKLINSELAKALKYELPTSAEMHEPNDNVIRDFGTFDFIIIGAGSTGSVIASRLSEISKWKVLLLEAGKYPNNFTMIPGFFAIQAMTEYNWGFVSTPQKTACLGSEDSRCVVHRGKGIGGTSLINQLIYSRGNPIDYDTWAEIVDDPSWRYENVVEFFKKSEDFHKTNPEAPVDWEYHGRGGNLYTNFHTPPSNFAKLFLQANKEFGKNITDYNGREQLGATILQLNTKAGRRFDQASAFIKPVVGRHNLIVSEGSYVIKIEINTDTKTTTSVLFTKNKNTYRAKVNLEVVLSAGAISSPQLLMLSGIGPKSHLTINNVSLVQDLEVGSSLKDHIFCPLTFSSNISSSKTNFTEKIKEYIQGFGDLTAGNPLDAAGWYKTNFQKSEKPDIEIITTSNAKSELGRKFLSWNQETWNDINNNKANNTFGLSVVLLRTKSAGSVRLKSGNPYNYPDIDSNPLSDAKSKDIKTLYEGIKLALQVIKTPTFRKIDAQLKVTRLNACSKFRYLSNRFWNCYIRHMSIPAFHPVGTCPSGRDPNDGAVVDRNLNVFGVKNLRVADASVIPFTFSGHPNAVCTMIGEKISDVIKVDHKIYL